MSVHGMRGDEDPPAAIWRRSLVALAGAGVATMAATRHAGARKSDKRARKRARKQGKKKCRKQVGQCVSVFTDICAGFDDPAICVLELSSCCAFLNACQMTPFFDCVVATTG